LDRNATVEVLDYYMDKFAQFDTVFDKQAQFTEDMPMSFQNTEKTSSQRSVPRTSFNDFLTAFMKNV
jgi:hypothetical protein